MWRPDDHADDLVRRWYCTCGAKAIHDVTCEAEGDQLRRVQEPPLHEYDSTLDVHIEHQRMISSREGLASSSNSRQRCPPCLLKGDAQVDVDDIG